MPLVARLRRAPRGGLTAAHEIATHAAAGALALTFPDDCRVCGARLKNFSRLPLCPPCLSLPEPLSADAFCVQCHAPFHSESALDDTGRCRLCRHGLTSFDALYCVGAYEGRLRDLIHLFKFEPMRQLDQPLGRFLRHGLPPGVDFDLIVPTPLHWTRRVSRGFNQSQLLARQLQRLTGIPLARALRKVKRTAPLSTLRGAERRRHTKGAFTIPSPALVAGKRILLVDDVYTTGSTANACAQALKKAGAHYVAVLALARADRRVGAGPEAAIAVSQIA